MSLLTIRRSYDVKQLDNGDLVVAEVTRKTDVIYEWTKIIFLIFSPSLPRCEGTASIMIFI